MGAPLTFDQITAERRALYARGGLKIITLPTGRGAMVAADPGDWEATDRANRYNALAAQHARMERRENWAPPVDLDQARRRSRSV